jgi:hypothetical protein
MVISIWTALIILIAGIIFYAVSRVPELDSTISRILYILGIVLLIIGIILLAVALIFLVI